MPILKRILVATDFSPAGHWAVGRAAQLARQWEARLFLAHARPDWNLFSRWRPASQESYHEVAESADAPLRALLGELQARYGLHAQCESRLGKASSVIAAVAAECEPDLVVVGARGEHSSFGRHPCLGGTALKLLSRIHLPLLLVRAASAEAYTSSLVAVDTAGAPARRAVLWASSLVPGGDCHIVHAYDVPYVERMRLRGVADAVIADRLRQAQQAAQLTVRELAGAADGAAHLAVHTVSGEPVAAVLGEVSRLNPQLVVVGKGEPPAHLLGHELLGGVGFRIAYHTPTDVLILSKPG